MTWLRNINMLELSPVKHPANRRPKLFQKSVTMEDPMVTDKALQEYLTKSSLTDDVKGFIKSTIEAMTKAKPSTIDVEVVKKAVADLFGFGTTAEEVTKAKADAEKAAGEEKAKLVETVKSALDKLQADKPLVGEAVNSLAELAGVTPVVKMVDQLPPEMKAQWEAMVKSNKANQEEMEKLQKSIDEQREATARQEFIAKAAGLSNIPLKAEELGELLSVVSKTDAEKGEKLLTTLKSVDELLAKGEALRELGTEGNITPPAAKAAITRLDKMAEEMVVKSAGKLTREQAFTKALELHPELYDEYNAATQ
jgi:hypothetical protein